jgi:long-chain acyl-CoA synthetase
MCAVVSGTTGVPKGAVLTHHSFVADMAAISAHGGDVLITENDVHISYLPLAHQFERLTMASLLAHGGCAGFSRGNPLVLLEDIEVLRPTTFAGVPRLYNRLYDKVMTMVNSGSPLKRWLFHTAYAAKVSNLRATGVVTHSVYDRLVFSKVAARLGGRVRIMVTGSAPIADNVLEFLRVAFSCHVVEGYGQTEATCASSLTMPGDNRAFGNVGTPLACNLIKLVDVPDMQYTAKDVVNGVPCPRGEVCFKGPNVFQGYYRDPEKTAEAIDADGWLHSGDIGSRERIHVAATAA